MSVRAKFRVQSIKRERYTNEKDLHTVDMQPVYSSDPQHENKAFWDATPQGGISIGCADGEAAKAFELGAEYYIDFTKAP